MNKLKKETEGADEFIQIRAKASVKKKIKAAAKKIKVDAQYCFLSGYQCWTGKG